MTEPETLQQRIERHEGIRFKPYLDTTGHWTIGCGHMLTAPQAHDYANGISQAEALDLLDADIARARAEVAKDLPWTSQLCEIRQEVLIEMVFQLGMNGLLGFKNLLYCTRSGDWAGAAHAMLDSEWHRQTPARCEELANLMLSGDELTPS
jgi:lysozyme